jgi:hypothetical protein
MQTPIWILSTYIGTDCIGSCISNYHTIVATVAPKKSIIFIKMKNKNSLSEQFQHLIKKYYWNKSKINTPKTHDCSLYWLGTDISIKNGGFKLILTSPCHRKRRKGWRVILSLYYITLFWLWMFGQNEMRNLFSQTIHRSFNILA